MAGPIPFRKLISGAMLLAVQTKPTWKNDDMDVGFSWAGLVSKGEQAFRRKVGKDH